MVFSVRNTHSEHALQIIISALDYYTPRSMVPQFFFEALDRRMLANGMVARCLVLDAGKRGKRQRSAFITIPESLKEAVRTIREYRGDDAGNLCGVTRPSMRLLTATDGANRMLDEIDERNDALYNESAERKELVPMAFWARATEKVIKLAMLYAISADVKNPRASRGGSEPFSGVLQSLTRDLFKIQPPGEVENVVFHF